MFKLRRAAALLIVMLLVFSSSIATVSATENEIVWDQPGSINLTKTATAVSGDKFSFKVTLTIEGKDIKTQLPTNVVIIIDKSGSMSDNSRMSNAKQAAIEMIDVLQPNSGSNISIAAITFGSAVEIVTGFYGFSNKSELKGIINGVTANGGTNIQQALKEARELLSTRDGDGIIVVVTDGAPTYSYKGISAEPYTGHVPVINATTVHDYIITEFNYSGAALGSGNSYGLGTGSYVIDGVTVSDNGIATISEAYLAKQAQIEIYAVNLDGGLTGDQSYVINNIASSAGHVINTSSADLGEAFTDIATRISYAAQDGTVSDIMGKIPGKDIFGFKPVLDDPQLEPEVSQGILVGYDSAKKMFTWDVGTIKEGIPAVFTYYLTATDELRDMINKGEIDTDTVLFPANDSATFSYTDVDGNEAEQDFDVPMVCLPNTRGLITIVFYLVDEEGYLLGENGTRLIAEEQGRPGLAHELSRMQARNKVDKELLDTYLFFIGQAYAVSRPDAGVSGYMPFGTNLFTVTPSDTETFVYFAYVQTEQKVNVTFKAEKGGSVGGTTSQTTAYSYGDAIVIPTPIPDSGYVFAGWDKTVPKYANEEAVYTAHFKKQTAQLSTDPPVTGDGASIAAPIFSAGLGLISLYAILVCRTKKKGEKSAA